MQNAILITGATSDLGYKYLKNFTKKDFKIIALYRDLDERLNELEQNYSLDIKKIKCDFLDLNNLSLLLKEVIKEYNIIKVLHIAAPKVQQERFNKIELQIFERDLQIQLYSIIEILKNIIPSMKKNKEGKIAIMLSSCTVGVPPKFWTSYVVSKYALLGLIKSLAIEYSAFNIQINGVSPSMMETKFLENMDERMIEMAKNSHPMKRNIEIKEVFTTLDYLLFEASSFLTGNNIVLSGSEVY